MSPAFKDSQSVPTFIRRSSSNASGPRTNPREVLEAPVHMAAFGARVVFLYPVVLSHFNRREWWERNQGAGDKRTLGARFGAPQLCSAPRPPFLLLSPAYVRLGLVGFWPLSHLNPPTAFDREANTTTCQHGGESSSRVRRALATLTSTSAALRVQLLKGHIMTVTTIAFACIVSG